MHHSFQEINTDSPKVSEAGNDSLSRKNQEQHIVTTSSEGCGESSLLKTSSDSRCAVLAFFTLEPDGNWRIGAMPVWCVNHISLATGVNMDALQLGFPPSLNRLMIDQQKGQRSPLPACTYSAKSFQGRSITGSNVHRRCQNKIANKAFKLKELTGNGCSQSSLICSNSSGLLPDSSTAVNSSCMTVSNSREDKSVKKSSRKKARKKGRQSKKHSCDGDPTKPEVRPEEDVCVSLASEICSSNDVDNLDKILFPDDRLINNDSERSEMGGSINLTEELKTCISDIDEAEMSKTITPTVQKFSGESAICTSKNQLQNRGSKLALIQDSLVLDSVSVGSNSDESTNVGDVVKQSNNSSCRITHSEPPGFSSQDGYILSQNLLKEAGSTIDHHEGIRHGSPNYSSNDKKVRGQMRSVPRSSSVQKTGGVGNLHGRTGKENSHSVWQKVQKNDSDECHGDLKKVNSSFSQSDSTSKRVPSVNKICNLVVDTILSKTEDKKHLKKKAGWNSRGKIDPASKKEYCSYSRKGSHFNRSISNDSSKISFQQNEMSNISFRENKVQGLSNVSGSLSHNNSTMFGFQTDRVEQITSESVDSVQVNLEGLDPAKVGWHIISTMNTQNIKKQDSLLPMTCDPANQLKLSEEQYRMNSHLLGNEIGQIEKEVSSADYNEQKHSSGSTVWRWIPIGKKDVGSAISESDSSSVANSDGLSSKDSYLESNVEVKVHSFSKNHISSSNADGTCMGKIFSNFPCTGEDENQKTRSQFACTLTQHGDKQAVPDHLIYECENLSVLENDSYKIAQSVYDVCRAQLACEAVQMATGSPIAEFERLLHCCSPVICQSINSLSCLTCLHDHDIPLCRHEIPNVSLGCLWQCYEKHGSYGLEIKAEEKVGVGHSPFRAYFVPSLSAVQLFKNCKNQFLHCSNKFRNCKASEENEINDMSENPSIANLHPICFPQAHSQDASISVPANQMLCSEVSPASVADNVSDAYMSSTCSGDLELLFEYFESEQPQQRQPLYEKIQELIGGDVPAHSKVYGDPTKLDSINLQDLHPRSWYSVAWYPIYRIPDGNFRASFLTYHSLGHLVRRSVKTESPTVNSCVVAPVVGLQSYNAQSECWFQLRHSAQRQEEILGLNPSSLLKERLQTLEETASLMARGVVNKGNLISKSRHPDFEFFLSRRRY